ncbi:ABC transporter permease [Lewinella sp. 4G2]|uniref:ABC transporter permease n=1 Tax=Lewinella sp. 4G2 TaxID=1803372 RepID=UPI0007B4E789|nr:ABC transporter permease [Lewinella sp. 4G2]OAV42845.1 hypothetical protein A3850_016585 [Lewinella sp. 4G2]
MNLPAKMSWRYLFARKSTNAINIITLIAAFGVAIGTAALVMVLSVFNGFEDLFLDLFNNLNPDVRITAAKGKTFEITPELQASLAELPEIAVISATLEETAMFSYQDKRSPGRIKGVDLQYAAINGIDTMVRDGSYALYADPERASNAVIGNQLAMALGVDPLNQFEQVRVYMARPKPRGGGGFLTTGRSSYLTRDFQPTGIIRSQEAFENEAVLIPLRKARDLLSVSDSTVSSLEIKLTAAGVDQDYSEIVQATLGDNYVVENRYQQENSILKIMQVEKWIAFAIVMLMMVVISFNLIGALWMIVLEKRSDISILRSLGMTGENVRNIFLRVGLLLSSLGLAVGFLLAIVLYVLQKTFSLVNLPGLMMEPYPISFRLVDFLVVGVTVLTIGLLASLLPARRAARVSAIITEE